jgi:hypothetical protein
VAKIQLTDEEAKRYSGCPVVLDFQSGFYMFPVSLPPSAHPIAPRSDTGRSRPPTA